MDGRRWLAFILGLLVVAGGVALYLLPELVRRTAIARIGAMTERPAAIDRVEVNVVTGRVGVHGFRLTERDGQTPFADFKRLDLRLHLPALLLGHLLLREVVLSDPTVRVQVKPFMGWVWAGCIVMALGGLLAASDRRYRQRVKAAESAPSSSLTAT